MSTLKQRIGRWCSCPMLKASVTCILFIALLAILHVALKIRLDHPVFTISGLTAGWLIAFLTGRWSDQASRLDEARLAAYCEIKGPLSAMKLDLTRLSSDIRNWGSSLKWVDVPHLSAVVQWQTIPQTFSQNWQQAQDHYMQFLIAFESSALLFWDLEELRLTLFEENDRVGGEWSKYFSELQLNVATNPSGPKDHKKSDELNSSAAHIADRIMDLATYLHDFGISLQNHTTSSLVGQKLPPRIPHPPHRTLDNLFHERRESLATKNTT